MKKKYIKLIELYADDILESDSFKSQKEFMQHGYEC